MTNEEANKVLEELHEVRPEMLNDKAKRLFEAIMTIADRKDEAESDLYEANHRIKEKIKAKIEEYKKQIEKMEKDDIGVGFTLEKEWSDLKAKVEFGQSLLEKE